MLGRVALAKSDVSEERIASIISVTLTVVIRSYETSIVSRAKRRNIPEDGILLMKGTHRKVDASVSCF
jgi:hypothetical protein